MNTQDTVSDHEELTLRFIRRQARKALNQAQRDLLKAQRDLLQYNIEHYGANSKVVKNQKYVDGLD